MTCPNTWAQATKTKPSKEARKAARLERMASMPSHFSLGWGLECPLAVVGLSTGISYLVLDAQTPSLSSNYIQSLNRNQVIPFDRDATYNWSPTVARVSDVLLYSSFVAPFSLLADKKIRKNWLRFGAVYAETFVLTVALTSLTKNLLKRPRPFVYNPNVALEEKFERDAQYAFFSGHTSVTAAFSFMTAKTFNIYNRGHKAVPWVWAAAITVPAVTGLLRQQAGKHFFTDVIVGYAIGAGIGWLVPELHRVLYKKRDRSTPVF